MIPYIWVLYYYKILGTCHGISSACYWFDYALESQCHIGHECTYTRSLLAEESEPDIEEAISSIKYHSIDWVIKNYLEGSNSVPECKVNLECMEQECSTWSWVE